MKKITLLFLLFATFCLAQKPIFTTAKTKAATVYFNSAEINQTTSVVLPKGTSEIVVKNVADFLNESTVRIGATATVTVLSVQFTNNYISEYEIDEKNPAIKKVRDSINLVTTAITNTQNAKDSETKGIEMLDKNQQFAGANASINVLELMKLVDYYKTKRTELGNNSYQLDQKLIKLSEILEKLNQKLEINTQKEEKASNGKLVLQVMNDVAGTVDFDINYITNNASWKPFYDLRATSIADPIDMSYKAEVTQNTGIDWKKVKLALSSGNPNQNNQQPILNAWFLRYLNNQYGLDDSHYQLNEAVVYAQPAGIKRKKEAVTASYSAVNANIQENQLNISFDIELPYDILSNGKAHSVALKEIKLPATYKYYAAPRLEKEAFLLAEIKDYSKFNLLQGNANIIFEGMYVGKTFINPNQTADTLSLSMGRDKKITIKREKVADKCSTKFLSAKKEQVFTYDITVRNNKKEAIDLLLKDQYPLTSDKEIEVEVLDNDNANENKETGILTWNFNLKPQEVKKIRISYKVRYPKDKVLENL
jgi:uncharacterized protein (TIGR02231 family)